MSILRLVFSEILSDTGQDADQQLELLPISLGLQRPEVLAKREPPGDYS